MRLAKQKLSWLALHAPVVVVLNLRNNFINYGKLFNDELAVDGFTLTLNSISFAVVPLQISQRLDKLKFKSFFRF